MSGAATLYDATSRFRLPQTIKDETVLKRIRRISLCAAIAAPIFTGHGAAVAAAASVHFAQNAAGTADGSSCANARSVGWFNTSGNWGTGTTQIGPGTIAYLCGTVTSGLVLQGSGASGSYVTIDGSRGTMAGNISTANKSWWKIQNTTWVDGFTGGLLSIVGGNNGVFTGNRADNFAGPNGVFLMQSGGTVRPDRMVISNNFIRTTTSNLGNTQHDIIKTEGSTNVTVEGNHLEMRTDGAGTEAHNDLIQSYEKGGTSAGPSQNWTLRFNRFVMNSNEASDRSWTMLEGLSGTLNIYGNVFLGIKGAGGANGINLHNNYSGLIVNVFNNTIVAKAGASNNIFNLSGNGTAYIRNNIVSTVDQTVFTGGMPMQRERNLWYGNRSPSCISGEICGQAPGFVNATENNFELTSSSPAGTAGANLGANYSGYIVAGSVWPGPSISQRSATGSWSIGAYESAGSATVMLPPTNLEVQ
jgi:hypothetical protein